MSESGEGLKRVIGVSGLTLSIISAVIGAGIFALPAIVSGALGAFAVFGYIVCGILMATILLCYAEIGSRVTSSGGSYAYVEAAFGNFWGYIINWLYFFGWGILGSAALMNIVGDSLAILFPLFRQPYMKGLLYLTLTVFIICLNIIGAKQSMGLIKLFTITKLLPLIGIIVFGLPLIKNVEMHWDHLPSFKTFGDATLVLFFAFAGFEATLGASGEIKNPKRTVPLSIGIAGVVILIIYMLLQAVVQGMLGSEMNLHREAPLAAVATKLIGPVGGTILLLCAALSCFGNINLDILCTPRTLFAGAKHGIFPGFLAKLHPRYATPYIAVILYGSAIFLFSLSGSFQQLAITASAIILLIYLAVILATLKLRHTSPEQFPAGFKAPGGLFTPLIAIVTILWLFGSLGKKEIIYTAVFILVIIGIYLISLFIKKATRRR